jgi:hypothetical protein
LKFNPFIVDNKDRQDYKSKLDIETENREKVIKEKLKEEVKNKIENIEQKFKLIYEEAEIAFYYEENWEKAKSLYSKLVQQGKFNTNYMLYNMAICDLNRLIAYNPEIINQINILIKQLHDSGASKRAQLIAKKLDERLNTVKQKETLMKKIEKPWWKKLF